MARLMYNVKDVQEILGVGESKAYQFIRILNEELRGKVFKYRLFDKRTFQALNNLLDDTQRKYVAHLINEEDPISAVYIAFRAGMISGKRIERAKKRKDR